ncbi:hypothetical protein K2O51_02315 [Cupriavidus pinatubonensis]|uniref:hypothetical protein n=1 Tax=Cupriavidus pinatubonensis TaxID=248026 RepID=UPI001C72D32C|nr:hypothetical protein [Cupriavidus pinatubonensis]QYY29077.1 hypothetical protein K2O51_02315 [Cupriavidus pinatubonensis]
MATAASDGCRNPALARHYAAFGASQEVTWIAHCVPFLEQFLECYWAVWNSPFDLPLRAQAKNQKKALLAEG